MKIIKALLLTAVIASVSSDAAAGLVKKSWARQQVEGGLRRVRNLIPKTKKQALVGVLVVGVIACMLYGVPVQECVGAIVMGEKSITFSEAIHACFPDDMTYFWGAVNALKSMGVNTTAIVNGLYGQG